MYSLLKPRHQHSLLLTLIKCKQADDQIRDRFRDIRRYLVSAFGTYMAFY